LRGNLSEFVRLKEEKDLLQVQMRTRQQALHSIEEEKHALLNIMERQNRRRQGVKKFLDQLEEKLVENRNQQDKIVNNLIELSERKNKAKRVSSLVIGSLIIAFVLLSFVFRLGNTVLTFLFSSILGLFAAVLVLKILQIHKKKQREKELRQEVTNLTKELKLLGEKQQKAIKVLQRCQNNVDCLKKEKDIIEMRHDKEMSLVIEDEEHLNEISSNIEKINVDAVLSRLQTVQGLLKGVQ
jgi:hypothetical protein